jgi:fatty acid desaturase
MSSSSTATLRSQRKRSSASLWRASRADAALVLVSTAQFFGVVGLALLAARSDDHRWWPAAFALVTALTTYNIIILSHLFVHVPWFTSPRLNAAVSLMNSANIAQSVQVYRLFHVRNHHRYNNDRPDDRGRTLDTTSTYRLGSDGGHAPVLRYVLAGLWSSMKDLATTVLSLSRGCRVGAGESALLQLASRQPLVRSRELAQIRGDRVAQLAYAALLCAICWQWALLCYLPAVLLSFALVNVQNYYRHFGAEPDSRFANSVSHYGRWYNRLTFNDGYHQEHHFRPGSHWSELPVVSRRFQDEFDNAGRVVSPVPAMVGFLDRLRPPCPASSAGRVSDGAAE